MLDGDVTPRAGLDDLVNSLYFAGVPVAVVSTGARTWVEPLVRQLIGDGIAETIVTPDDLPDPRREPDLHGHALWELGHRAGERAGGGGHRPRVPRGAGGEAGHAGGHHRLRVGADFTGSGRGALGLRRAAVERLRADAPALRRPRPLARSVRR